MVSRSYLGFMTNLSTLSTAALTALITAAQAELSSRAPVATFSAQAFEAAFEAAPGYRHNYVLLADLRAAMPGVSRAAFDAGLNDLRRAKAFSLDSADGRHVQLTPAQLEAGIRECGSNLVYCARRN